MLNVSGYHDVKNREPISNGYQYIYVIVDDISVIEEN